MRRNEREAVSFELLAMSCKLQAASCKPEPCNLKFLVYSHRLSAHYSQHMAHSSRLIACSLSLLFFSLSSSFAQESNRAVQEGNDAYKTGDYKTAAKDYSKALEADKKNTVAWFNMGNALQKTMNSEEAAESYDEAINNAADDELRSKAYYNKALAMLQEKNLQAAIDAFKQSLRLMPGDNDARENLQKALN